MSPLETGLVDSLAFGLGFLLCGALLYLVIRLREVWTQRRGIGKSLEYDLAEWIQEARKEHEGLPEGFYEQALAKALARDDFQALEREYVQTLSMVKSHELFQRALAILAEEAALRWALK